MAWLDRKDDSRTHAGWLLAVGALALALRTVNLALVPVSLWGDEVLLMGRADHDFAGVLAACVANAEHPPLVALVMAAMLGMGASETVQRLVPIALGVATVLLLGKWAGHRFGRRVGLVTAVLAAVSPFHVRYSQELRPYAWVMFFALLALVAADRLEAPEKRARWALLLALVATLGFYSHNLFAIVLVPLLWPAVEASIAARRLGFPKPQRWALGAVTVGFLAFVPWLAIVGQRLARKAERGGALDWGPREVLDRVQELTVETLQGGPLLWGGWLGAAVLLLGVAVAARGATGRVALAGFLAGTLGVELVLQVVDKWTAARYDALGWLFVPVLLALGLRFVAGRSRHLAAGLAVALLVASAAGWADYARRGRPDWRAVTALVRDAVRPMPGPVEVWAWKGTLKDLRYYVQDLHIRRAVRERFRWREFKAHRPLRLPADGRPLVVVVRRERLERDGPARAALEPLVRIGVFERAEVEVYASPAVAANLPASPREDPVYPASRPLAALARFGSWGSGGS